jgi:hypothetical protein
MSLFGMVVLFAIIFVVIYVFVLIHRSKGRHFLQEFAFPEDLKSRFASRCKDLSPGQVDFVFDGLREFFQIAIIASESNLAMPSRAVGELWHEFSLSGEEYERFCQGTFGYHLYYAAPEAPDAPGADRESLCRTWTLACELESIDPKSQRKLPLLFSVDRKLNCPDGFYYVADCTQARMQAGADKVYCGAELCDHGA